MLFVSLIFIFNKNKGYEQLSFSIIIIIATQEVFKLCQLSIPYKFFFMPRNPLWSRLSDQIVRPVRSQINRSPSIRINPTFISPFCAIGYQLQSFSLSRRYFTSTTSCRCPSLGRGLLTITRNPGIALTRPQTYINARFFLCIRNCCSRLNKITRKFCSCYPFREKKIITL